MFVGYQHDAEGRSSHQCIDSIHWSHFSRRGQCFTCHTWDCCLVLLLSRYCMMSRHQLEHVMEDEMVAIGVMALF